MLAVLPSAVTLPVPASLPGPPRVQKNSAPGARAIPAVSSALRPVTVPALRVAIARAGAAAVDRYGHVTPEAVALTPTLTNLSATPVRFGSRPVKPSKRACHGSVSVDTLTVPPVHAALT